MRPGLAPAHDPAARLLDELIRARWNAREAARRFPDGPWRETQGLVSDCIQALENAVGATTWHDASVARVDPGSAPGATRRRVRSAITAANRCRVWARANDEHTLELAAHFVRHRLRHILDRVCGAA